MVMKSTILCLDVGEGTCPPPNNPRVGDAHPAGLLCALVKSPNSFPAPVDAIVIN